VAFLTENEFHEEYAKNKGLQTKPSISRFDLCCVNCSGSLNPAVIPLKRHCLRNIDEPRIRQCPDCNTSFSSVQSTGICPSCQLVFDVDAKGNVLRRRTRVGAPKPPKPSPKEQAIKHVRKYLRFLNASKITTDEFNFNLLLHWVGLPNECWTPSASEMPNDIAMQFSNYLDDYLIRLDYKPSPTCFMVGPFDSDLVELKKKELEPRYREIHDFWRGNIRERGITKR
jgi:hypothetical protein